jgi:hypothetical protein
MQSADLPDLKMLTFFTSAKDAAQKKAPIPFTRAEILGFAEVQEWLAKGYELDTYENKLSPKDPHQVILLVVLARKD